ncbi:MAG: DNA repair protein RecO [Firmicutes bacterium]|nr:DNA repair protein RecO [Bacillota bacterium]
MDNIIIKSLVIKATAKGEADAFLTLLSEAGKFYATIKGVKKANARLAYAAQPFNFGEYIFSKRGNNYLVTNCTEIDTFFDLQKDYDRYIAGCAVLDILDKITIDNEYQIFLLTLKTLAKLTYEHTLTEKQLLAFFILKLLHCLGLRFQVSANCASCGTDLAHTIYYEPYNNGIICAMCKTLYSMKIERGVFTTLKLLDASKMDSIAKLKLQDEHLHDTLLLLDKVIQNTLEFKSVVLDKMLNSKF